MIEDSWRLSMRDARTPMQVSGRHSVRDVLLAKLGTLGVGGAPSRVSTSSELRSAMNSGATPAPTPRSPRCLRILWSCEVGRVGERRPGRAAE